ncbi:hypothetical protein KC614_02745, partial [candidate division WWE3 bacterium]|nr:hypothetical protein [candidate division WWE3 bacterium]
LFMALSTLAIMLQMAKRQSLRLCMLGGLFMALTILSHPEISVFLLITLGLYFVFEVKNRGILMWFLGSFVVAALLITPWFWGVYSQHGIMPFLAAINSGNASYWGSGPAIALLTFDFIGYNGLYLFGGIGLLGLLIIILKKRYFFFVWPLVIAVINYRSFGHFVPIFFGLYVGVGLIDVVVVGLTDWIHKQGKSWSTETIMKATVFAVYLGAIYYVSASFMGIIPRMSTYHTLDANNREAMYWVTLNTPVQSRFLVLDVWAFRNWPIDMVSEWFPYVADRSSIMTIQGREWLPDFGFSKTYTDAIQLAKCSDDIKCFLDKLDEANLGPVDYIYIDHHALAASENVKTVVQSINEKLYQDWGYEIVYDDGTVTIWRLVAD